MIRRVRVKYFKKFEEQVFDLADSVVLAGPNNSGKTTLLQAIAVWNLALQKWLDRRARSKAKERTGVPITRKDFTAIPLREMSLLWFNTSTKLKKGDEEEGQPGTPRTMSITLEGDSGGAPWHLTFEFSYQSSEQVYAKPSGEHTEPLPQAAQDFQVIHVPPFSGIGAEETRYDRPYQDLLIGQGKAGDIVRNLLLEVHEKHRKEGDDGWPCLCREIETIFGCRLQSPEYEGRPFILSEYLQGIPKGKGKNGLPVLDIASGGSGFHQVLLLLGFFYARPSTVLLLDEPDAHLHVILQKQVYDRLRSLAAEQRAQLIIATHSEVLVDATSPDRIMSFYGSPHTLVSDTERDQVREALKRVNSLDMLLSEQSPGVLYVEGESDFNLLRAWAKVLGHATIEWFEKTPYWYNNQGRNPKEARAHFFAMRAIKPEIKGFLLLDGDNRGLADREVGGDGLIVGRWKRYEIESYLFHPVALRRFAEPAAGSLFAAQGDKYLNDELPPPLLRDPLGDHAFLASEALSKTLLPAYFRACELRLPKIEYFRVAEQMLPEEVHLDVKDMLDQIGRDLGIVV